MVEIKGRMGTLVLIRPDAADLSQAAAALTTRLEATPGFFEHTPAVIDLSLSEAVDELDALVDAARAGGLLPYAYTAPAPREEVDALPWIPEVRVAGPERPTPRAPGGRTPEGRTPEGRTPEGRTPEGRTPEAPTPEGRTPEGRPKDARPPEPAPPEPPARTAAGLLVTQPVRSGQQIYARGGDLIVVAAVGNGAELLADGHIHVYGPLRGRAMAGVQGDTSAMVFCRSLEAELVSIAGTYKVSEDFEDAWRNRPVAIALDDDRLVVRDL